MVGLNAFCADFEKIDTWKEYGWIETAKVDGSGVRQWNHLCDVLKQQGKTDFVKTWEDWPNNVIEVENQELFHIQQQFVRKLKSCERTEEIVKIWGVKGNGCEVEGSVESLLHADSRFQDKKALNFPIDHLSQFTLPNVLQCSAVAGIFGRQKWFTEGHIEVCGDDSVSLTVCGRKVFVYAAGFESSRYLVQSMKTVDNFMDLAYSGPPDIWRERMSMCIPKSTSLRVQPSLFAHSVLTTRGPSLVVGWEAGNPLDLGRLARVSSAFGKGMGYEQQEYIRRLPYEEQRKVVSMAPGDIGELLRRELASNGSLKQTNSKFGRKPKRWDYMPNNRMAAAKTDSVKRGKLMS